MKPNVEKIQNLFLSGRLLKGTVNVISIDPSWKYGKAPNLKCIPWKALSYQI